MMGIHLSGKSWPIALAAVAGSAALLFVFAALSWMNVVCEAPGTEAGKLLVPGVGGCIEFWLNRYQSSVAALVAIFAAGLAWKGVQGQIETSKQQVDVANRQFAASALAPLQQKAEALRRIRTAIADADWASQTANSSLGYIREVVSREISKRPDNTVGAIIMAMRMCAQIMSSFETQLNKLQKASEAIIATLETENYEKSIVDESYVAFAVISERENFLKKGAHFAIGLTAHIQNMDVNEVVSSWNSWCEDCDQQIYEAKPIRIPVIAAAQRKNNEAIGNTIKMIER